MERAGEKEVGGGVGKNANIGFLHAKLCAVEMAGLRSVGKRKRRSALSWVRETTLKNEDTGMVGAAGIAFRRRKP